MGCLLEGFKKKRDLSCFYLTTVECMWLLCGKQNEGVQWWKLGSQAEICFSDPNENFWHLDQCGEGEGYGK